MPAKRIEYIDLAKGFCILLVVFVHANSAFLGGAQFALQDALESFWMPLYFFLSGLFFKPYEGYVGFLKRKVNKLLIPFLFFHIVSCFTVPLLNKTSFEWHTLWDFLFRQGDFVNGPLWFLICLFWLNQIFYAVYKVAFATRWPVTVIVIISLSIGLAGFHMGSTVYDIKPMNIDTALTALPFFAAGYLCNRHTEILYPNRWDKYLLYAAVACGAYTIWMAKGSFRWFLNMYEANAWVTYTSALSGVFCVLAVSKMLTRLPIVSYFGRYSIMILVTHMPFMQRVMPLLFRLSLPQWWMTSLLGTLIVSLSYLLLIPLMKRYLPYVTAQKDLIPIKGNKCSSTH